MLRLHFVKFDLWPFNHKLDKEVTVNIFLIFVQGQHIDTATFAIWACLKFDLSLTLDNFGCLSKVNMLTLLLFPFEVVIIFNLHKRFVWPIL